jgi:UDP-glucose 4-epimerase
MDSIEGLLSNKMTNFVRGSVTNFPLLLELFQNTQYVFHHAAIPSVLRSIENPQVSHETNLTGTLNVLVAARDNAVEKVIYASSSAVYGNNPALPTQENMVPCPLSPYAVAELAGEYYGQIFQKLYKLPIVYLRYFNVYGQRQEPNSQYAAVIPRFTKRIREGKPPVIFGDGEQTRDFIFVKDAVAATILAAQSDTCGLFNISSGESSTVNRLAKLIIELVSSNVEPIHQESKASDIRHSLGGISKAKTFGYEPKYDLRSGLAETIRWFNSK